MKDLHAAPESLYWYWIAERHSVFLKRQAGLPKPWTEDPILQSYKFTNPFRENDKGTVWLRDHFLRPYANASLDLLVFNCAWYRMFNWWGTGQLLGWQTDWDPAYVVETLTQAQLRGEQVFTGAHIVYSPPGRPKIDAIVEVCSQFWDRRMKIALLATQTKSLEAVFNAMREIHCVGGFMAYEIVTDLRHTRVLEGATDIMTWANPGPGAKRGLQRLGLPSTPDKAAIESMRELLSRPNFPPIALQDQARAPEWTCRTCGNDAAFCGCKVPLEMRDIEHSLCEFDKYSRVKYGEGEPRSKYDGA